MYIIYVYICQRDLYTDKIRLFINISFSKQENCRKVGVAMPEHENRLNPYKNGNMRKKGTTIKQLIELISSNPGIEIKEMAAILGRKTETVRVAYKKLMTNPDSYASRFGFSIEPIKLHLIVKEGIKQARKKRKKIRYIKPRISKAGEKVKKLWRGKANWPAAITAKNKSISTRNLVKLATGHYIYDSKTGLYIGDGCINNSGSPGFPRRINIKTLGNML